MNAEDYSKLANMNSYPTVADHDYSFEIEAHSGAQKFKLAPP